MARQRSQNNSVVNLLYGSFYEGVGSSVFRIEGREIHTEGREIAMVSYVRPIYPANKIKTAVRLFYYIKKCQVKLICFAFFLIVSNSR